MSIRLTMAGRFFKSPDSGSAPRAHKEDGFKCGKAGFKSTVDIVEAKVLPPAPPVIGDRERLAKRNPQSCGRSNKSNK